MEGNNANKSESSIFFVNLTTDNIAPVVSQRLHKRKDYIYFGKDNLFPQYLIDLADNCAIHAALLETKQKFIQGQGFTFDGKTRDVKMAESFLESLDKEFLLRSAIDVAYFDGLYWQALFERGGKLSKLKNVDFSTIRSGKMNDQGDIEEFYFSSDWEFATRKHTFKPEEKIYEPLPIASWGSSDRALTRERGQLIQVKSYKPGKLFYAEPSYLAATNYIEISAQLAELHKNNIDNGMVGSMHIHLYEDLSDTEKRRKVEKAINSKFVGSENAGKVVVTWSTDPTLKTEVNPIPVNNSHEMYAFLDEKINAEIAASHRVPLALAGIKTATGLQSEDQLSRSTIESFQNVIITPSQNMISRAFQKVLEVNGINVDVSIKPLRPVDIVASEELMLRTMTLEEIRKTIGLGEIEGDVVLSEQKQGE